MKQKILVTGGLGYIGSHTVVELQSNGYDVVIVDNLANSNKDIVKRIEAITNIFPVFYNADLCDSESLSNIFKNEKRIDAVVHFAAYKAVGESQLYPLKYFQNNLVSIINLLKCMIAIKCNNFIFSSSATVYGEPEKLPLTEADGFKKALSAYGSTKQIGEEILEKVALADKLNVIALRYFNPVGAHDSALIGELPIGKPNNLLPIITQTAVGKSDDFTVFGNDYSTPDGTCIRDYVHVVDLANAHLKACERLFEINLNGSFDVFNIGTGKGYSVLEIINQFELISGVRLGYKIGDKRSGDAPIIYADVSKANNVLGWKANRKLDEMIKSAWKWELSLT